ncbi:unnamed protein product [Spirodela intermedia]|uniref:Uncharacterized protein n=1 Tax=Spirodela intermedia TaxID=51605 RepID=A0A7I8JYC7_SPIIN|nr:unnamed protein product [Spirodela intermedia]
MRLSAWRAWKSHSSPSHSWTPPYLTSPLMGIARY